MRAYLLAAALAVCACAADARPRPTVRQLVRAGGLVQPGDPWPAAYLSLQDRLGPPTRVVDDRRYQWATPLGDDCYLIEVAIRNGVVVFVDDPYRPAPPDSAARCWSAAR